MLALTDFRHRLATYPRGDPRYVPTADEQIEDLKKVTLDDVRKFYQDFYGASVGEIAISGQFNAPEISKLATELFGNWKSPGSYTRVTSMYQKTVPSDHKIETPDKQNAFFVAGQLVKLNDEDPDYPALVMANYMFGGSGLGTRLSRRIRDKEGLSYGVQSDFAVPTKDDAATFVGVAISAPQNTPKVEASFRDELAKTLKEGFTADEVAAAKKAWLQERGMSRSEDGALVGLFAARQRFDRTLKFDESLETQRGRAHAGADQRGLPQARRPVQPDFRQSRRLQESRGPAVVKIRLQQVSAPSAFINSELSRSLTCRPMPLSNSAVRGAAADTSTVSPTVSTLAPHSSGTSTSCTPSNAASSTHGRCTSTASPM